jgi:hypothetical protein
VDEPAVADVETDVAERVEEDEIGGTQPRPRDAYAQPELRARVVRQGDPEMRVDEAGEPGAVEAGARRGPAEPVGNADQAPCVADDAGLLARNPGRAADVRRRDAAAHLGRTVDCAERAGGPRGDAGKDDEHDQHVADAVGHEGGSLRQGRRPRRRAALSLAAAI